MLVELVWATAGAGVLILIYRHVQMNWPQSYFGPAESVARYFSQSGLRYLIFRFFPPYLIFVVVGIYAPGNSSRVVLLCAAAYGISSTLLSIRASVRGLPDSTPLTAQRTLVLVTIVLGIAGCAWAAVTTYPRLEPHAPDVADITANLVAAALAAVLTVSFIVSTRNGELDSPHFPAELSSQIEAIAVENNVDPTLAVAIGYTENQQRPQWFRQLERAMSWMRPGGSYGLFQVKGHGPVDDLESTRIALAHLTGVYPLLDTYGTAVDWSVLRCAERHNPDARFARMVASAYDYLSCNPISASDSEAPDGRPLLVVWSVGRFGERMRVRGTYWSPTESVSVESRAVGAGAWTSPPVTVTSGGSGRSSWYADVSPDSVEVLVRTVSALDECFTEEALTVDLRETSVVERDITLRGAPPAPGGA